MNKADRFTFQGFGITLTSETDYLLLQNGLDALRAEAGNLPLRTAAIEALSDVLQDAYLEANG